MGVLRERMIEEMKLRNFSPATQESYVYAVSRLARYHNKSPDQLSKEDIRAFLVHLTVERKLSPNSLTGYCSGLRFFYNETRGGMRAICLSLRERSLQSCPRCSGHFKNVHGTLEFDPGFAALSRVEAVIDTRGIWSGEPDRDAHLKSPDFLDVGRFPEITFRGSQVRLRGPTEAVVIGDLTIRGITRLIELQVQYLGQWKTLWWEDGMDKGPKTRAGFLATTQFNRHDFGVSWNSALDQGGLVVGDDVAVIIDAEAILEP